MSTDLTELTDEQLEVLEHHLDQDYNNALATDGDYMPIWDEWCLAAAEVRRREEIGKRR